VVVDVEEDGMSDELGVYLYGVNERNQNTYIGSVTMAGSSM
jgi:hypothetical protein